MFKKILALSLFCCSLSGQNLYADNAPNGNWLLGICSGILSNTSLTPNNNYCAGFIQGIMLAWYTAQTQINPQGAAFWLNQFGSIPALKSAQMVTHYLVQNPQSLNQSAVSLIIAAMNLNYPIPPAIGS